MWLKPDQRPWYDKALKALSAAHTACFNHEDRDVLGMSHGPFSGVNEALGIVLTLETLVAMQAKEIQNLKTELISLRTFSPNKGKNMNDTYTEAPVGGTDNVAVITDVKHYVIDEHGNRVEVPFDPSNGEASSEETTVYIAADEADHIVTVH